MLKDTFEDTNDSNPPDEGHAASPTTSTRSLTNTKRRPSSTKDNNQVHTSNAPPLPLRTTGAGAHDGQDTSQLKSPLLTSHRLSTTSLDNVNLEEDVDPHTVAASKGVILLTSFESQAVVIRKLTLDTCNRP
jgi:hypothetical protein